MGGSVLSATPHTIRQTVLTSERQLRKYERFDNVASHFRAGTLDGRFAPRTDDGRCDIFPIDKDVTGSRDSFPAVILPVDRERLQGKMSEESLNALYA